MDGRADEWMDGPIWSVVLLAELKVWSPEQLWSAEVGQVVGVSELDKLMQRPLLYASRDCVVAVRQIAFFNYISINGFS